MKRAAALLALLLAAGAPVLAQTNVPPTSRPIVQESDGSPSGRPSKIKLTGCTVAYVGSVATITCNAASGDVVGPASATDNALARFDTTTGKLVQNSLVCSPDAQAVTTPGLALCTDPDTGPYWPAANTYAIAAGGKDVARFETATNAVNYLDVTPGASGASVKVSAVGTNADLDLAPSAVGREVNIRESPGSGNGGTVNASIFKYSAGVRDSTNFVQLAATGLFLGSGRRISWQSADSYNGGDDTGLSRIAAGVIGAGTGSAGSVAGWMRTAGKVYKAADETVSASTTLQSDDHLTVTLAAGRTYIFNLLLFVDDTNARGITVALGGTATHTNLRATVQMTIAGGGSFVNDGAGLLTATGAGVVDLNAGGTSDMVVRIQGTTTVNAGGTFLLSWAQRSASSSTTVKRGSYMIVEDGT